MVKELITDNSEQITQTNLFVWGNDLSQTLQGAGGVGGLLAQTISTSLTGSTPLTVYPLYDHNGNVEKIIRDSGAVVAEFQYDAFGNTISETISTNSTGLTSSTFPFRFSTKYFDSECDLYYYGYRYYSPKLGRFIKRDLAGVDEEQGLYEFSYNNTIMHYDYLGNMPWDEARAKMRLGFIRNIQEQIEAKAFTATFKVKSGMFLDYAAYQCRDKEGDELLGVDNVKIIAIPYQESGGIFGYYRMGKIRTPWVKLFNYQYSFEYESDNKVSVYVKCNCAKDGEKYFLKKSWSHADVKGKFTASLKYEISVAYPVNIFNPPTINDELARSKNYEFTFTF
jgi:RHS repeat-associated protein